MKYIKSISDIKLVDLYEMTLGISGREKLHVNVFWEMYRRDIAVLYKRNIIKQINDIIYYEIL